MIPSERAFWWWGLVSLLVVAGFLVPWLAWLALALDALVAVAVFVDAMRAKRIPLEVRREMPDRCHQLEPATLSLLATNPTGRPLRLRLRDSLPAELADTPVPSAFTLAAGTRETRSIVVTPRRRGEVAIPPPTVRVLGPWALAWAQRTIGPGTTLRVLPQARFQGEEGLFLREVLELRAGPHARKRLGLSQELHALREYHPGDDIRRIHWKATARLRRPIVTETTWEQHQHLVILLDAGRPMAALAGEVPKLDRALAALLALLRVAVAHRDHVTLVLFSREIRKIVRVDRHVRGFREVFEQLYAEQADRDEPDYAGVAAWCVHNVPRRSLTMLCTSVSDALAADTLEAALAGLRKRHRPVLVNLEDPALVELAGSVPGDVVGAYVKTGALLIEQRNAALHAQLRAGGVEVLSTPADGLLTGVVRAYLDIKARG